MFAPILREFGIELTRTHQWVLIGVGILFIVAGLLLIRWANAGFREAQRGFEVKPTTGGTDEAKPVPPVLKKKEQNHG